MVKLKSIAHGILPGYNYVVKRYSVNLRERVKRLRHQGHTYGEIRKAVGENIPKSTLSEWCRGVRLPDDYEQKIADLNLRNLSKALKVAMVANKLKRQRLLDELATEI